jgi:hypothetical protein
MMMSNKKTGKEPSGTIPAPPKPPEKKGRSPTTMAALDLGARRSSNQATALAKALANGQQTLEIWQVQQWGGSSSLKKGEKEEEARAAVVPTASAFAALAEEEPEEIPEKLQALPNAPEKQEEREEDEHSLHIAFKDKEQLALAEEAWEEQRPHGFADPGAA